MFRRIVQTFANTKKLKVSAESIEKGMRITYPNLDNKTQDIENALETFIACLAVCETATLRALVRK
jgi:hypothetical protein